MKIKTIKVLRGSKGYIGKGEEFEARILPSIPFQFNAPYQIIEGEHSGAIIPRENAIEIENEKIYTEKEWNDLENHYLSLLDKESEKAKRAEDLVMELTKKIEPKNKEIEKLTFFVEMLSTALKASCKAIEALKEQKAN
ncbi:hydrolytic enzyme [Bacillus phage vB_Bacillus_1020A]|uniref:hypothetical protein n=1 Tax=Robertmurraya sp. DFI.2.37 TaxID=3031819 RepID=UPI00124875C7|nr:hypothetical protein [Robertmurraya sp. DFI.2.37]MDF1511079.1 hypothetical protein [Robertmurraya sp. DFI.2.37]QIW89351.1 hydrolytic enzyme [Bacillus phage vB_Bacillus_1020A]